MAGKEPRIKNQEPRKKPHTNAAAMNYEPSTMNCPKNYEL
jgi:hypothetical protein